MTEKKITRRAALAFVALTEAPTPIRIGFTESGILSLDLPSGAALRAWLPLFGAAPDAVGTQRYDNDEHNQHGVIVSNDTSIKWRGWSVLLRAFDDDESPVTDLDDATRARLTDIAEVTQCGSD